jgi:hypothetical protein
MQRGTRLKAALVGVVVTAGAAATALLGPAGAAVGQASQPVQVQIQVNSPATLVAKGAGADVLVTASCSGTAGASASIFVNLTEHVENTITSGNGFGTVGCTGTSQTVQVLVIAGANSPAGPGFPTGSKAFKKGTAVANAQIEACTADGVTCAGQQVQPTITIS